MDILALPDVILRKVMRCVRIKDRLKLRLTCRAFGKLVAETNAGCFERGGVTRAPKRYYPYREDDVSLCLQLGDQRVKHIDLSEEGLEQFLHVRNRLFTGISFEIFEFDLDDDTFDLEFIRKLIDHFRIDKLRFQLGSEEQLEKAKQLMKDYPGNECTIYLWFLPETQRLFAIPPIRYLKITAADAILFKLLSSHNSLTFGVQMTELTLMELKSALEALSADDRKRRVKIQVKRSAMVKLLRDCGITDDSKEGDVRGGFEVMTVLKVHNLIHLRYKRCLIEITFLDWKEGTRSVDVDIANCDEW
ncbi:hypothetical protein PRIPAC_86745 [Pristionchus pacificus]|uniref:F-box domain-containing protein n=1 Tax=Pristionchus pacificus TaxID=54126 RepID=A0A2A6CEJ1_PRIPA|nr:hypothetical protein PRIPAC_86745 [Pristionchus pacificus]|eukprot:PDM76614.1 F-box domain-containing protein [Pristionchus pacificus]